MSSVEKLAHLQILNCGRSFGGVHLKLNTDREMLKADKTQNDHDEHGYKMHLRMLRVVRDKRARSRI